MGRWASVHAGTGLCHPFIFINNKQCTWTVNLLWALSLPMVGHCTVWALIFLLIQRVFLLMHWLLIKVAFLAQPRCKGSRRFWYPQMKLVGLLLEKEKLDTAGGCFEEETCFTLPERFLHLIRVGRCENGWVRLSFLTKAGLLLLTSPASWRWFLI